MSYLVGTLKVLLFHSDSNGFTSCKCVIKKHSVEIDETVLKSATQSGLVTLTGHFNVPQKDVEYRFFGEFTRHPKYGVQFGVQRVEINKNDSEDGLLAYLSSGHFEGVGPTTAKKIIDALGLDAIDKIKRDPEILKGIVPERRALVIRRTILENSDAEEALVTLCNYGFTPALGMRLIKFYGKPILEVFNQNPYKIIDDIEGVGFETIDTIALKNGVESNDTNRIKSLLKYVLKLVCNSSGYTYLTNVQLLNEAYRFVGKNDLLKEDLIANLQTLINDKEIIQEEERLYDKVLHRCEVNIANRLQEISKLKAEQLNFNVIGDVEKNLGIKYAQKQIDAIKFALTEKAMVLTGGPGTGKTTVVKGIIESLLANGYLKRDFALIAPTGRAAKRINEQTGMVALTIHRFLGYDGENNFERNEHNQVDERVIIVDESSMIDLYLFNQLLKSIKTTAKLIIVGDDDQLPSVGPGQILKDVIDSGVMKVCKLTDIHRQSLDSNIVQLAHKVRLGEDPTNIIKMKKDVSFISCKSDQFPIVLPQIIDSAVAKGNRLDDLQILAPLYKRTNTGIDDINKIMQQRYNPANVTKKEIAFGSEKIFREDDKVIQSRNRVLDNVMNGDVGYIMDIIDGRHTEDKETEIIVNFEGEAVRYRRSELIELNHAYSITIHKSQGSEYPIVILPIFNSYSIMLKRKLLYTAITRAKKALVIVGEYDALMLAINSIESDRQSTLVSRIITGSFKTPEKKVHLINDPEIPFTELGEENMEEITPYSFME